MVANQIAEDVLRADIPPKKAPKVGRLVKRGPILVKAARGKKIGSAKADAALNAVREGDIED